MKSVRAELAKAFGNRPEDKSGVVGLPSMKRPPRPKVGLDILLARLRRYEQRMVAIRIECDEYIHKCGEEPGNVTRIIQILEGKYDT